MRSRSTGRFASGCLSVSRRRGDVSQCRLKRTSITYSRLLITKNLPGDGKPAPRSIRPLIRCKQLTACSIRVTLPRILHWTSRSPPPEYSGKASEFAGHGRMAIVGRDTRASGEFLSAAVVGGLAAAGVNVYDAGVLPTPAVAFLTPTPTPTSA